MKVRRVLLDADFIAAVANANSSKHGEAVAIYQTLIDGYAAGTDRLFALSTVLSGLEHDLRRVTFGPVETLYVAGQHRSAARKVRVDVGPETALTLVLLGAEKIRTVVTFGDELRPFDITLISDVADEVLAQAVSGPDAEPAQSSGG